jgi:hypothetical protein
MKDDDERSSAGSGQTPWKIDEEIATVVIL